MAIFDENGNKVKPYYGDRKPVNIYLGEDKLAGYHEETKSGESVSFATSYNDVADVLVHGNTEQKAEYYIKEGMSSQETTTGKNLFSGNGSITDWYHTGWDGAIEWDSIEQAFKMTAINGWHSLYYNALNDLTGKTATISFDVKLVGGTGVLAYIEVLNTDGYSGIKSFGALSFNYATYVHITCTTDLLTTILGFNIRMVDNQGTDFSVYIKNIQIELGSSDTGFEKYTGGIPSPNPNYPQPITSNIPAGTYKYTSTDGIYEFTLADDLRGIDTTLDKIVFDRVSHNGYVDKKIESITRNYLDTVGDLSPWVLPIWKVNTCTFCYAIMNHIQNDIVWCNILSNSVENNWGYDNESVALVELDRIDFRISWVRLGVTDTNTMDEKIQALKNWMQTNNIIMKFMYKALTPTRTPLTFTKVTSSTATEVPMTFIETTPCLDYPSEVYDVSGNVKSRGKNLFDKNTCIDNKYQNYNLATNLWAIADNSGYWISNYIPIKKGAQYISNYALMVVVFYDELKVTRRIFTSGVSFIAPFSGYALACFDKVSVSFEARKLIQIEECSIPTDYEPYVEPSTQPLPTLRKIGIVEDTFDVKSGIHTKRISDWVDFRFSYGYEFNLEGLGYKKFALVFLNMGARGLGDNYINKAYKYDSKQLENIDGMPDNLVTVSYALDTLHTYICCSDFDTGMGENIIPTAEEVKSYFYGWKMCNADGSSPYYKSEVPYNPSTWAEWSAINNGVVNNNSVNMGDGYSALYMQGRNFKSKTKYGFLFNVSNCTNSSIVLGGGGDSFPFSDTLFYIANGNIKATLFTRDIVFSENTFVIFKYDTGTVTVKDIRIFELPTGSQIESDFNTLTADQLCAKYTFNGLCEKNWKHVTDGLGKTNVLPVASYDGYTPYKMIYQLATPIETQLTPQPLPTYYPSTIVKTDCINAIPTLDVTVKVED